MAVLCMKNEWIPILPEHNATHVEGEHVLLSATAGQSTSEGDGDAPIVGPVPEVETYIPDRFGTPEDSYDDDAGPSTEAADPNSKNSDDDIIEDIDFDTLPSTISLGDLAKLTSRLQAHHTQVQGALKDAAAATREAAANALEMMARLENEKARMKKIIGTVAEIVGEYDEKIELNEGSEEEAVEVVESNTISEKRKGKQRATDPIRSLPHSSFGWGRNMPALRPSPLCPNCRVARDLTQSQRHSVYLCAEHMPNPYQDQEANGSPDEGSQVPTSGSSSNRNDKRRKLDLSSGESTIIFGFTTKPVSKPVSTSNPSSKGKKRSLDESEADEDSPSSSNSSNQSLKRARLGKSNGITQGRNSQQNSSSSSTAPLRPTIPVRHSSKPGPEVFTNTEREEASSPERGPPLRRTFTIEDFDDPEEVAKIERMEALCFSAPRRDFPVTRTITPANPNIPPVATPTRNAPLRRTFSIIGFNDAEEPVNPVREQRQLRRRIHGQTPGINNPIQQPSTSNTGPRLRRTVSILDLNDLEEVANAEREENFPTSGIPPPGPTLSEEPAIAHRQDHDSPTPRAESSCSGSTSNTSGKRPRDSDDDDEDEGQKRIQKKGRVAEA